MKWIIFQCACAAALSGFLLTSGEHTTNDSNESTSTAFSNFLNSTIYTTEDSSNVNSSDSNSLNNPNTSTTEHDISDSAELSHKILSSTVLDDRHHQLASDVATKSVLDTVSSQEKDYLESQSVKKFNLVGYNDTENSTTVADAHFSTETLEKHAEMTNQDENSMQSGNSVEGKSNSRNSSAESIETTTSDASTMDTKTDETTIANLDSIQDTKSTLIKSTKKRSIGDQSSDISTTSDADDKTTLSGTETSKMATSDEDVSQESTTTGFSLTSTRYEVPTSNETDKFNITHINDDATTEAFNSLETKSPNGSLNVEELDLSLKNARTTRKRRLSTEKNITSSNPTSSMPPEDETDAVRDASSIFDFPEHISSSDTEAWPDSLQPESEWTEFSSHSSNSESIIKESNILSDDFKVREYMDRPETHPPSPSSALPDQLVVATHPSESSTNHLEINDHNLDLQTQSSGEVTSVDFMPSENVDLKVASAHHSISTRSTHSEVDLSSITTIPYDDKETKLMTSDKLVPIKPSPEEIIKETLSTVIQDDTTESSSPVSSNNDSEIILALSSALRQGIVLEPSVAAFAKNSTEHTLSSDAQELTSIKFEIQTKSQEEKVTPETVSSSTDVKSDPGSQNANVKPEKVTEINDYNTLSPTKEAVANQFSTAEIPITTSQAVSTEKAVTDVNLDVMLGDGHHLIEMSPNDTNHENISSTVLLKSDSANQVIGENKQVASLQTQTEKSEVRPVEVKVANDAPKSSQSSQVGDVSSNKISRSDVTVDVKLTEASNVTVPQTLSPVFQSSNPERSNAEISTVPFFVEETNVTSAASIPREKNESLTEDSIGNKTGSGSSDEENSTIVISGPPPTSLPIKTTSHRMSILKPKLKIQGSNPNAPQLTRKPFLSTHRPRAASVGEPVGIFNKNKTRKGSITSSTTQRPTSPYSVQNIRFVNRVPDSMIPLGPGIAIDVTLPATTTEAPTTTEEPYSEEPFTDPTQVPSLSSEDDVTLVKLAGTVTVVKGIRWNDQLDHRNSPHYKKIATQMHRSLERLFRTSTIAKRVWSIDIDGFSFSERLPKTKIVIVDFIISLIKSADHEFFDIENMSAEEREEKRLAAIFNEKLKNNTYGRYTVDPIMTEFKVLEEERRNKPTEAPGPEPPIPQWAIAVIVIGAASLIFIVLFAAVTMYGRHHMRRRYSNKLSEEDIDRSGDWESKMAAAYENLAADTIYDAEDGSIESMKRRQRPTHQARHQTRLKRYDSWYSGNITVSPKQSHRHQVHRIVY